MCLLCPGHKYIRPKAIHDAEIVDEYSKNYIYFACIKFIDSVSSTVSYVHSLYIPNPLDQNCFTTMALTHAGRHLSRKPSSHLIHSTNHTPLYTTGQNMGQSQLGHDQNVPRGSAQQAARHATFPLRFHPPLRRAINPGFGSGARCALGSCTRSW